MNLDRAQLQVNQSLEQTKKDGDKGGLRFKAPKTRHGRRTMSLSGFAVAELRAHKGAQNAQRLALGLGKPSEDRSCSAVLSALPLPEFDVDQMVAHGGGTELPKVSFHALRHTHASQLIASGLDVLTISRRLGHGMPSITLDV